MLKGPCQPFSHDFTQSQFGDKWRCFQDNGFKNWEWFEYSVSKDAAFCFWCYLFRGDKGKKFGDEVFIKMEFRNWKKATEKFKEHVRVQENAHNDTQTLYFAFKDQRQVVTRKLSSGKQVLGAAYRTR